jgi:hypothetical protein
MADMAAALGAVSGPENLYHRIPRNAISSMLSLALSTNVIEPCQVLCTLRDSCVPNHNLNRGGSGLGPIADNFDFVKCDCLTNAHPYQRYHCTHVVWVGRVQTAGAPSSQPRPGGFPTKMPQVKTAPVQICIDDPQDTDHPKPAIPTTLPGQVDSASNLSHGGQVPQVAREPRPRWTAFNNSDQTPLGSDETLEVSDESTRLRAEVTLLRDMLVTANIHAASVTDERASPKAKVAVSKPGRGGNRTLMERLEELSGEVKEAKSKRLRTEILGCFILLMYLVIGITFYTQYEGWTWQFALYFCVTIATTVG